MKTNQSLDAGFRPGMGHIVPDRFFWALPDGDGGEPGDEPGEPGEPGGGFDDSKSNKGAPRRVH